MLLAARRFDRSDFAILGKKIESMNSWETANSDTSGVCVCVYSKHIKTK